MQESSSLKIFDKNYGIVEQKLLQTYKAKGFLLQLAILDPKSSQFFFLAMYLVICMVICVAKGHGLPKFLAHLVVLCFERQCP